MWIWVLSLFSSAVYCYIIIRFYYHYSTLYNTVKSPQNNIENKPPQTKFSIIIAVRNEAENLAPCLKSLQQLNYPLELFEIIFINDDSSDQTVQILQQSQPFFNNLKILHANDYSSISVAKKKALEYGISEAIYPWIICTDGDSVVPPQWLASFDYYIQQHDVVMIAAPCELIIGTGFWQEFQQADFLSLQGITAAVVSSKKYALANGANLAYSKESFIQLNGFAGHEKIPTGDDMLLMQKMYQKLGWNKIGYLLNQNAIVKTNGAKNFSEFIHQRVRWGSKFKQAETGSLKTTMVIAYLFQLLIVCTGLASIFYSNLLIGFLVLFLSSAIAELIFMVAITSFFKKTNLLKLFILFKIVYGFYYLVLGCLALLNKYEWKGRKSSVMEKQTQ